MSRAPVSQPLRVQEPLHLAFLFDRDSFWDPITDALSHQAKVRSWNLRLWFADSVEEQRAEVAGWRHRSIQVAVVVPAGGELRPALQERQSAGQRLAVLGWINGQEWGGIPHLVLLRESGARQGAQAALQGLREVGIEQPVLLYFGRNDDCQRRPLARQHFQEAVHAQGGEAALLLTAGDRRSAKQTLKRWLFSSTHQPAEIPSPHPPASPGAEEPRLPVARAVHAIYAEDETLTLAMLDAVLETALRPPLLIGAGTQPELVEALGSGRLDALVGYLASSLATQVADWAGLVIAGEEAPADMALEPLLLTSEDLDLLTQEKESS